MGCGVMKQAMTLVMALSALTFLLAAGLLYTLGRNDAESAASFTALSQQIHVLAQGKAEESNAAPSAVSVDDSSPENFPAVSWPETDDPVLLAYRETALAQPDFAGWLQISGTVIDYPVMRSINEAERYLHQDFEGRYSRAGTLFMMPVSDPAVPNENIIIYGHHMKNGSMFGELPVYETLEGYEANPFIQFDTLYERGVYQIIAVFRTSVGSPGEFRYYEYEWLDDEPTFYAYIENVMARRLYDTGESAVYGDRLLTLSTCDYHEPNGRLVVVAKKVQETEEQGDA